MRDRYRRSELENAHLAPHTSPTIPLRLAPLPLSLQIWSMALGVVLRSIVFPVGVLCVVLDPGEYTLFAGGADGRIFMTDLNQGPEAAPENDDVLEGHK